MAKAINLFTTIKGSLLENFYPKGWDLRRMDRCCALGLDGVMKRQRFWDADFKPQPVKDVVRQYTGLVDIVKTAEEFVAAAERILKNPPVERIEQCLAKAQQCGWEATVANMQRLIKEAITKPGRRSSKKIEPLTEAELEYQYQHTQGS